MIVLNGAFLAKDSSTGKYFLHAGPAFLWDLQTDEKIDLPHEDEEQLSFFSVSPNHKWLAYSGDMPKGGPRVSVVAADGTRIRNAVSGYNWFSLLGWLDNDRLAIWMLSDVRSGRPFPTLVYNPFNRDRQLFMPDYPDLSVWYEPGWPETQAIYDPTVELVAYAAQPRDAKGWTYLVLWDIQGGRELRRLALRTSSSDHRNRPVWSPDGDGFVFDLRPDDRSAFELYVVTRSGEMRQLTHFGEDLHDAAARESMLLLQYSWSPDGRQIAYWYNLGGGSDLRLAVADVASGRSQDFCIVAAHGEHAGLSSPVWAPDSGSLLVDGLLPGHESVGGEHVVLLNLVEKYAVEIAQDMIPGGWLSSGEK